MLPLLPYVPAGSAEPVLVCRTESRINGVTRIAEPAVPDITLPTGTLNPGAETKPTPSGASVISPLTLIPEIV